LNYVFPHRDVNWRLNWFNEVKIPLLTAVILHDDGTHSLDEKIKELEKLYQDDPTSTMNLESEPHATLQEEKFVQSALHNRKLHARAKVLV
jgi:hypothetical protein